jgi:hypothetical protein
MNEQKELREELMTQKDMATIQAQFEHVHAENANLRREMNDKFDAQRREIDIRFAEMDKRMRIYMAIIIGLMLILHPSVGALLGRLFGGN